MSKITSYVKGFKLLKPFPKFAVVLPLVPFEVCSCFRPWGMAGLWVGVKWQGIIPNVCGVAAPPATSSKQYPHHVWMPRLVPSINPSGMGMVVDTTRIHTGAKIVLLRVHQVVFIGPFFLGRQIVPATILGHTCTGWRGATCASTPEGSHQGWSI